MFLFRNYFQLVRNNDCNKNFFELLLKHGSVLRKNVVPLGLVYQIDYRKLSPVELRHNTAHFGPEGLD